MMILPNDVWEIKTAGTKISRMEVHFLFTTQTIELASYVAIFTRFKHTPNTLH